MRTYEIYEITNYEVSTSYPEYLLLIADYTNYELLITYYLLLRITLYEFNPRHDRSIAPPRADFDYSGVTAFFIAVSGRDLFQ